MIDRCFFHISIYNLCTKTFDWLCIRVQKHVIDSQEDLCKIPCRFDDSFSQWNMMKNSLSVLKLIVIITKSTIYFMSRSLSATFHNLEVKNCSKIIVKII